MQEHECSDATRVEYGEFRFGEKYRQKKYHAYVKDMIFHRCISYSQKLGEEKAFAYPNLI